MPHCSVARKGAQYLALAPLPSLDHRTTSHGSPPLPSCIQLWSISPTIDPDRGDEPQGVQVSCQLVACIDDGPVKVLKWSPLPSHDDTRKLKFSRLVLLSDDCFEQQAMVSGNSEFWAPLLNQGTSVYTSFPIRMT